MRPLLLVLTAIIAVAAVTSTPLNESKIWSWQVGKEYVYTVNSFTWVKFEESKSNGNVFKALFIIRVLEPGRLVAKLEYPVYSPVQCELSLYKNSVPTRLNYIPVKEFEHPFEIIVDGGRVVSLKIPTSLSVSYENLLKGLVGMLQVDLSSFKHVDSFPNSYDQETFQGLFKKMETDVTGECETLYSVSPLPAEWRRELLLFAEDPIEITKVKNYGSCEKNVGYNFGVPEGAVWKGTAYDNDEKQFIKRTSESRILAGKQGTIYRSEAVNSVLVNPLLFGKQKAEVYSYVSFYLLSIEPESSEDWKKSVEYRTVESLLFTFNETAFIKGDENIVDAQKLLQEMAPLLLHLNTLPKTDFLSKFNIVVRSITFMNLEQLNQLTSIIEAAKFSKNIAKQTMWKIYRDAVAQAGTIAAFKEIKSWILTKKIEGEEAGEVISSMASVLRFPNKETINNFFDFVMSPEVQEQKDLNTTALLAVTKFISRGDEIFLVEEKVIPRLSLELKQAIEKDDKNKAQVYVRVLGNLADPNILKVFAPYLEGKIPVSKYLRIQMVLSLKTVANTKNEYVRAVLFSLLKNTAEPYEVRVAAALNIFLAFPTQDMLQIMAHMTNVDPSTQVRAVLTNSITFAAELKDPRFAQLAKAARSVLNLVSKEKFGYRYSTESLVDEYMTDDELAHFRELSFIGSENHLLPLYQRGALRLRGTGLSEEDWFTLSVSDMQHLTNYLSGMYYQPFGKDEADFKFSAKKIAEILNIKPKQKSHLEGSFFLNNWNQQTLFTFSEEDVNSFLMSTGLNLGQPVRGESYNYTKVLTQKQVFVTFPLVSGMPFKFDYSEPTAIIFEFQAKANHGSKDGIGMVATTENDLNIAYARNLDGSVGFMDTIGDVYAGAGIINKFQFFIPVKYSTMVKRHELEFSFEFPERDVNIFHLSVWPYTTLQKTGSLLTVLENPSTKLIERPTKFMDANFKFGQSNRLVFGLRGYSYSADYQKPLGADLLTNVRNILYQKDVALTDYNFKYYSKMSGNKKATYTIFYDKVYKLEDEPEEAEVIAEMGPAAFMNDVSPNARREEIIKRVQKGMQSSIVQIIDISAVFDGKKKIEHVFTGAFANSFVDLKSQAALFYKGIEQINAVFNITKSSTVPLNFQEALCLHHLNVQYEADVKIGKTDNIHFKGFGERSYKYTEKLRNDPLGKQCLQETSKHNFYQKNCYQMIIKAQAPDYFKGLMTHNVNPGLEKYVTELILDTYRNTFKKWYNIEDQSYLSRTNQEGIEIVVKADYYANHIDYKFTNTYGGALRLLNIEGLPYYPYAMAIYAPLTSWERTRNWFTDNQNLPFCTVDDNKIWTFSGRSYEYSLTSAWHVVMVDKAEPFNSDLVILMRRPSDYQSEVYVSYNSRTGKSFEMELTAKTIEVITNITKVSNHGLTTYFDDIANAPLLQYYTIDPDTEFYSINDGAIRLIFDTHRLVIFTDDHRSATTGICGHSTTQINDDYLTPYGLVDRPDHYGASFSLESEDSEYSDVKTVELKKEAKLKAYHPVTKYTTFFAQMLSGVRLRMSPLKDCKL